MWSHKSLLMLVETSRLGFPHRSSVSFFFAITNQLPARQRDYSFSPRRRGPLTLELKFGAPHCSEFFSDYIWCWWDRLVRKLYLRIVVSYSTPRLDTSPELNRPVRALRSWTASGFVNYIKPDGKLWRLKNRHTSKGLSLSPSSSTSGPLLDPVRSPGYIVPSRSIRISSHFEGRSILPSLLPVYLVRSITDS
jgi:hypothetical protein